MKKYLLIFVNNGMFNVDIHNTSIEFKRYFINFLNKFIYLNIIFFPKSTKFSKDDRKFDINTIFEDDEWDRLIETIKKIKNEDFTEDDSWFFGHFNYIIQRTFKIQSGGTRRLKKKKGTRRLKKKKGTRRLKKRD